MSRKQMIRLEAPTGCPSIGKKVLSDKIHAPEELSKFFFDMFFVRFHIRPTPYHTNNASKSLGVMILMPL